MTKNKNKNKNITLQNHTWIMPLYNSFKPQPFGTNESLLWTLSLRGILLNINFKNYDNAKNA